ncbi:hypothetical protein M885DRAFT_82315 [Pelagophyceae sp. CCMP2097]|nr:hypothetical protein M885DRAFT_82315 [Pelagophyceae sp. CCMP2097]
MGVRRLRQLLEEQYGACFPLGPVGSDVALVLDGNNFALWLAKKTVNETRHAGYGALDAAVRDVVEMYRRGAPERRIVAVFDGAATAAERLARAATLEARAHQRGDVASAAAYEGGSVVGGLALEQVAFTLSALGVDVRRARGEADAAIAWLCASCAGSALAVTDDTDLALYRGVRVLRLSTTAAADGAGVLRGVVVSRALISQAFGVSEAEVVEVCFALGTDEVKRVSPQPPRSSASDVVTWFVSQRPTPRFTSPDAGHALAITHARRRYDLDAALVPGFLDEYEDSDSDGEMFQDEASLAAFALKAAKVSEKHRNAILRFVCGERFTAVARSLPTPADRDAAYLYERACRDGIRRQKAWHLEPAKLFDAPTFYDMVGTAATILTGPTGDAGPAVDVLQRAASPLLSVEASAWQPLAVEASTWAPRLSAVEWSPAAHVEAHFEDSETSDDAAEAMTTSQSYGSLAHSQTALSPEQSAWDAAAQEAALDEFEFDEQPCGLEGLDASATAWAPVSTGWAPDACATAWAPATAKASSPTNSTSKSTYVQSLEAHVRQLESLLASRGMPFPSGPAPPRIYADDADADADLEDGLEDVLDEAFGESASQANPPAAGYPACGYPVLTPYVPGRAFPGSSALGAAYGSMATTLIGVPAFSSTFEVVDEDDHVVVVPALGEPSVEYATEPAIVQCADLPELPIDRARKAIVDRILQAQCTIVRGETGSGKSTRLPRFILEDMPGAKVVVAQPRRLAALQLYERAKADGVAVGVRVGMAGLASGEGDEVERGDPSRVRLWYMTSGVCAKLLCYNPSFFDDVTHLCVDEVHERDVDTDVVLALARRRLESLRQPRVVLLSATLDARLLVAYFRTDKPIDVEGRRFVLRRHALDAKSRVGRNAI